MLDYYGIYDKSFIRQIFLNKGILIIWNNATICDKILQKADIMDNPIYDFPIDKVWQDVIKCEVQTDQMRCRCKLQIIQSNYTN